MEPAVAEAVQLDEQGRLGSELRCIGCGYLLVGMTTGDRCPECGMEIRRTIAASRVATWPDEWIRSLKRGIRWLIGGVVLGWIFMIWWMLATLVDFDDILPGIRELAPDLGRLNNQWLMLGMVVISIVAGLTGTMLITFSQGARAVTDDKPHVRWFARLGMILGLASLLAMAGVFLSFTRWSRFHGPAFWFWVGMFVAGTIGIWNVWNYLARIAGRIPDERLARRCRRMSWSVLPVALLLFANAGTIWPSDIWVGVRTQEQAILTWKILAWTMLVGRVAFLIIGIVGALLLVGYLRALGRGR